MPPAITSGGDTITAPSRPGQTWAMGASRKRRYRGVGQADLQPLLRAACACQLATAPPFMRLS